MADPSKSAPTFSFGTTATGGTSNQFGMASSNNSTSGGRFGSGAPKPAAAGSNLFGSSNVTPPTSSSTVFGSTPTTSAPQPSFGGGAGTGQSGTLFGSQASGGGGLFGGNTGSTGGFSSFSTPSKPSETPATSTAPSSNLFGGTGTGASSIFGGIGATPATISQAGAVTPAASKPGSGLSFGTVSTTPAGPPPAGGIASDTKARTGFNFAKSQEQKTNSFGGFGTQTSSQTLSSLPAPSNLFAGVSGGSLLRSNKPAESTPATSTSQPTSSFFGTIPVMSGTIPLGGQKPTSDSAPSLFADLIKPSDSVGQTSQAEAPKPADTFSGLGNQKILDTPSSIFSGTSKETTSSATTPPVFSFPSAATTSSAGAQSSVPDSAGTTVSSAPRLFPSLGAETVASPTATGTSAGKPPNVFANLGTAKDNAPATSATSSEAPSSTTAPATGSLFDRIAKPLEPSSSCQPAAQATTATSTAAGGNASKSTNLGASTTGPKPPAQSRLRNKSMDEIITRWASDLAKYQKEFQKQALKVSEWDRMLVENSDKIQKLYGSTLETERATAEVERQLSTVENDQTELEYWLDHYGKQVDEMISSQVGQGDTLQGPDQERERTSVTALHTTNLRLTMMQI